MFKIKFYIYFYYYSEYHTYHIGATYSPLSICDNAETFNNYTGGTKIPSGDAAASAVGEREADAGNDGVNGKGDIGNAADVVDGKGDVDGGDAEADQPGFIGDPRLHSPAS